jgi:glycosyltransferase involved in cell wall biosynthesis
MTRVAFVHDYLTQRGGAERVVLAMLRAYPDAPLYTSFYEPSATFTEFRDLDIRTSPVNHVRPLRHHHRLALPVLAPAFSATHIDADVVVCSSAGWAHGVRTSGRKIVYCHTPARWLYQTDRYLRTASRPTKAVMGLLRRPLLAWDRRAAAAADRYLAVSSAVRVRVAETYGVDADLMRPPPGLYRDGPQAEVERVEGVFVLCVARLMPYKNVDAVLDAARALPDLQFVFVGSGPDEGRLRRLAPDNALFVGEIEDPELRWLYDRCRALIAASHEDYGLTPLEAAEFGRPSVVLRWGGFLDSVIEGKTGLFFDEVSGEAIAARVKQAVAEDWDEAFLQAHAFERSDAAFTSRFRELVTGD